MAHSDETRDDSDQVLDENTEAPATQPAEDAATLAAQLTAAGDEITSLKDQILRVQAEAENVRRRAARDVENAHKFALEKFAAELLPVVDSLEKAVESAQIGAEASDAGAANAIGEGVELSLKLFYDVLEKAGISRIHPKGEPFDPQYHEAMAMLEHADAEPNSVLDVMQPGYTLNGRLVRPAMVVVSKAPATNG